MTNLEPLYFQNDRSFYEWLADNHKMSPGVHIYMYKKGHEKEGLTYEEAVRTALCFGWIDAVTHSCDETRFIQYFAPRLKSSNWSLSNMIRMRDLIEAGRMTEHGLIFFDIACLDDLDEKIEAEKKAKSAPVEIPEFFQEILEKESAVPLFEGETTSAQRRFIAFIMDAKKEETRIRRCHKVISILKGAKNNL